MDLEDKLNKFNKVLIENKFIDIKSIEKIISGDILAILNNYFVYDRNKFNLNFNTTNNSYVLTLDVKIDRIKNIGILPNNNYYK